MRAVADAQRAGLRRQRDGREIACERSREQVQADIDRLNPAMREYRR